MTKKQKFWITRKIFPCPKITLSRKSEIDSFDLHLPFRTPHNNPGYEHFSPSYLRGSQCCSESLEGHCEWSFLFYFFFLHGSSSKINM
jgi:hypothetical protein